MSKAIQQALQKSLQYLQSGQLEACIQYCDQLLADNPDLIQARYLRGCAKYKTGDIPGSVIDLEVVHAGQPGHLHAAYYYGRSLRAAGRYEEALAPLQTALVEEELKILARYELATCLARLRRRPEAIDHYLSILALQPGHAQVAANLASLLERENRLVEADEWVDKALSMTPDNDSAQMTRATLDRRDGQYGKAAQRLQDLVTKIDHPVNRSIAWNQLGQCFEGQGDWDQSFRAFGESNRILTKHHPGARPDPVGPHGLLTLGRIREWLEKDPMADWKQPDTIKSSGIAFLFGFPRSGTTLLDRMLSAHPDIEVLEEKSLFSALHQDWSKPGTLEALTGVHDAQISDAREIYRGEMARHRVHPQRSLVIDKLPLNLPYLFLIRRLFPEAPVIFLQRHPLDVCLSCYFQAFELEASMAYFLDLADTAHYYDAMMQVAALSMDQAGDPLHRLRYEDLVASPEDQLRKLIEFLSLDWAESVLDYHQQGDTASSNTPSYQQVSQALYTCSIGKWRHYQRQLEPVRVILQPWIDSFGYKDEP